MPPTAVAVRTPRLKVQPSSIHGLGLFADEPIEPDQLIGRYEGPRTRRNGPYVLWIIDDDGSAVGINGKNELRYLNHSATPNAELYNDELYALRRIERGEEITIHYGDDWRDVT